MNRLFPKFKLDHLRTYIAISILIIFAFVQSVSALQYYDIFYMVGKINKLETIEDPVDKYSKLLKCVKQNLGEERTIGFITSLTDFKAQHQEKLFQTQYILAPIIVDDSAEHKIVVGYYPDEVQTEVLTRYELKLKKDCENGLFVFEKK